VLKTDITVSENGDLFEQKEYACVIIKEVMMCI
jgi:hypothetical protein